METELQKKQLITEIMQVYAVSNDYGGDMVFMNLLKCDVNQLKKIASELYIKTD